jgi:hypothetical protein
MEEENNSNIPEEIQNDTAEEEIIDVQPSPEEEKKKEKNV